ncbi:unnamed protein product [Spirodela intermedia]|uniref:Uncharacterized protein n=1 Tax=Spirodela intermedia TaxID=51605 RepID=A0A7I8JYX9_SPIIN|nr:unnamed protein product [Spirodela intermedia]
MIHEFDSIESTLFTCFMHCEIISLILMSQI